MEYRIEQNKQYNSNEVYFNGIPSVEIRNALKGLRYRWHNQKKCWYGYSTAEEISALLDGKKAPTAPAIKAAKKINLDNLDRIKLDCCGADFAKKLRQELKTRGAEGVTIRCGRAGYTSIYTITIALTPADFVSVEELQERAPQLYAHYLSNTWESTPKSAAEFYKNSIESYKDHTQYSHREINAEEAPQLTKEARERVEAIRRICMAANYDHSDIMTDYFDVGYYLDICYKCEAFEARETMTEAERETLQADRVKEAEEKARQIAEYERQKAEREKERQAYEKKHAADLETINNNIDVVQLAESENYFITGLIQGIGKEASIKELEETTNKYSGTVCDALIDTEVYFKTAEALEAFSRNLMDDFSFLAGKGGTACNDARVTNENYYKLNQEQRDQVKFYSCHCVAFYYDGALQFVSDPQGHNYSRYTMIKTESTKIRRPEEFETIAPTNEGAPAFFIPEAIEKQAENLTTGQEITIFYNDVMCLNMLHETRGKLAGYSTNGSRLDLIIEQKKKLYKLALNSYNKYLIYGGSMPETPREILYKIDETREGFAHISEERDTIEVLKALANRYGGALVDTVQR